MGLTVKQRKVGADDAHDALVWRQALAVAVDFGTAVPLWLPGSRQRTVVRVHRQAQFIGNGP